jgi:hypothetical protein
MIIQLILVIKSISGLLSRLTVSFGQNISVFRNRRYAACPETGSAPATFFIEAIKNTTLGSSLRYDAATLIIHMVIRCDFGFILVSHYLAMNMAVSLMVINTQDTRAVGKSTFSIFSGSF